MPELVYVNAYMDAEWHVAWSDTSRSPLCGKAFDEGVVVYVRVPGDIAFDGHQACRACADAWYRTQRMVEREVELSSRTAEARKISGAGG